LDEEVKNLAKEYETAQRLGLGTGKSNVREMKNSLAQEIEKLKEQLANPVCSFIPTFDFNFLFFSFLFLLFLFFLD
jgi:hypothetical protein